MICNERPPNYDLILAKFPGAADPRVIFAYGNDIYNPSGQPIHRAIEAHEQLHCRRQLKASLVLASGQIVNGPDAWWIQYINDESFRYQEELAAHIQEYHERVVGMRDRNAKAGQLMQVAQRLVAPLYGYDPKLVTLSGALRDLRWAIK